MIKTLAFLLLFINTAQADVIILKKNRILNKTGIQCAWASLETIARHQHIKRLYTLTNDHKIGANSNDIEAVLDNKKVKYRKHKQFDFNDKFLKDAILRDQAVMIGYNHNHAVVLIGITKTKYRIIDNGKIYNIKKSNWDGWAIKLP